MDFINQNMQVIVAAAAALGVLVIALILWRAISPRMMGRRGQRLGVSEYYELDKTRRLVLVRRDNVEHLILIGGPEDLMVESGITVSSVAASYAPISPMPENAPLAGTSRPAPRPPIFGERKPPPPLRTVESIPPPVRTREGETE
jgi:Flagellar biosynthesis protein, FliO